MTRTALWTALALVMLAASGTAAQQTAERGSSGAAALPTLSEQMKAFARNVSLGEKLMLRPGSPKELDELDGLARRGLAAARAWVEQDPDSADAHYLLGSWLLYGYRVVETRDTFGMVGAGAGEVTRRVVLGLGDDCTEGLQALRTAALLAPDRGQYAIDYGAALLDCGESEEARSVLRDAWDGRAKLTVEERVRTAILLSRASLDLWRFAEAREWAYAALSQVPGNAPAVQRLKELDRAQAEQSAEEEGEWEEVPLEGSGE